MQYIDGMIEAALEGPKYLVFVVIFFNLFSNSNLAISREVHTCEVLLKTSSLPERFSSHHLPKVPSQESEDVPPIGLVNPVPTMLTYIPPSETGVKFIVSTPTGRFYIPYHTPRISSEANNCSDYEYDLIKIYRSIDPKKNIIFIIGGFIDIGPKEWALDLEDRLHKLRDVNIVQVTWNGGNQLPYMRAVSSTKIVARQISVFLHYVASLQRTTLGDEYFAGKLEFVGHSLGAHIAGFVGQDLNGRVGRIVALDPAGPMFSDNPLEHRLDKSDAQLVEAFHTNADYSYGVYLGILKHVGHIDYYPNGGNKQPVSRPWELMIKVYHEIVREYLVTFIDHEILLKSLDVDEAKDLRLLAFRSERPEGYNRFLNGSSFVQFCPLITNGYRNGPTDMRRLVSCSVPLDFDIPWQERRKELAEVYGINFEPHIESNSSFYFNTLSITPYHEVHHFLRLVLRRHPNKLSSAFLDESDLMNKSMKTFDVEFNVERNAQTTSTHLRDYELVDEEDSYQIFFPFISPYIGPLKSFIQMNSDNFTIDSDPSAFSSLLEVFPHTIGLTITKSDGPRIPQMISRTLRGWLLRLVGPLEPSESERYIGQNCLAIAETLRIEPLLHLKRSVAAYYTIEASEQKNVSIWSPRSILPNISEETALACLHKDDGMKLNLKLDTIMIGLPDRN